MGTPSINIGLLSSGRSDFNIYLPLIREIEKEAGFNLSVIAFGSHLNSRTEDLLLFKKEKIEVKHALSTSVEGDTVYHTSLEMAKTLQEFAELYHRFSFDLIICLGDRFEMLAAVEASIPWNIPIAHLHGGETTLGAFDDKIRHAITSFSTLHFTSTEDHARRVEQIIGNSTYVFNVGALALDNLNSLSYLTAEEFLKEFGVDLTKPTVLATYHPETNALNNIEEDTQNMLRVFESITNQILITLPNPDPGSEYIRRELLALEKRSSNIFCKEVLGLQGYYTALKHCKYVLGNSSSGIIEAASFGKYVINVGDRQKGRSAGDNVIHVSHNAEDILTAVKSIGHKPKLGNQNIYGDGNTAQKIVTHLKDFFQLA
jgi:GDP/UDP-N,N'-diacetylbacillosamine 2-epimerase (hydrolysing)